MVILGYDPGGAGAGGVAVVDFQSTVPVVHTATCDSVDAAVDWFQRRVEVHPRAIGVDSLMSWATGPSGWRPMDRALREEYPKVLKSVLSSNSAFGSFVVQGMALAIRLRELWPEIHLNETHPKVLYYAMTKEKYPKEKEIDPEFIAWLCRQFTPQIEIQITNDHEWDAVISAWATWKGLTGQWQRDLMNGATNLICPAGTSSFFWPESCGTNV